MKSFNREKSIKRAESREKQLAKIDVLEKPQEEKSEMHMTLTPSVISGNDVLRVEGLSKAYDQKKLFQDISFGNQAWRTGGSHRSERNRKNNDF